jgi:hypothetical protein
MSSLTKIAAPGGWKWPRQTGNIQKERIFDTPSYIKNAAPPAGKYSIQEGREDYQAELVNGYPRIKEFGATHWANNQYPAGLAINTKSGNGGLCADGWSHPDYRADGSYLSTVSAGNLSAFVNDFLNFIGGYYCGTGLGYLNYQVVVLNGESWHAFMDNGAGSKAVLDAMVEIFNSNHPTRVLGIWAASSSSQNLTGVLSTDTTTYKTSTAQSIYAQSGFKMMVPSRYINNNTAIDFYYWIFQSDIAKRVNPTGLEVWSVWVSEERIDGYEANYSVQTGTSRVAVVGYVKEDGSQDNYQRDPLVNPMLFYASCLWGYFVYDGVYAFGYLKASTNKEHINKNGYALISVNVGNENVYYETGNGLKDWDYRARYEASVNADIIDATTDWFSPEFSIDGGVTWQTGDNRLVPNCYDKLMPIIKMKYDAAVSPTEALIISQHPKLTTIGSMSLSVMIRDTAHNVANTFTLKSVAPYIGRITI